MNQSSNITIYPVILAAGKGTRMNLGRPSPVPKVLISLGGKPMVSYILETLKNLGTKELRNLKNTSEVKEVPHLGGVEGVVINKPTLVIGYKGEMIQKEFGDVCNYVWQRQRLGTGHAARLAIEHIARNLKLDLGKSRLKPANPKKIINNGYKNCYATNINCSQPLLTNINLVLILQGDDSAFYKTKTLEKIFEKHLREKAVLTFVTTHLPDAKNLGRVIRDKNNNVIDIVEKENMTSELEKFNEINCGAYLFNLDWGTRAIKKIKKHLKDGKEYPLPDIIKIALLDSHFRGERSPHLGSGSSGVIAYEIPSSEWRGINSPEQLKLAEQNF